MIFDKDTDNQMEEIVFSINVLEPCTWVCSNNNNSYNNNNNSNK